MPTRRTKLKRITLPLVTGILLFGATAIAGKHTVRVTSYNSLQSQTDSTPFITSTGTRTRIGVVAASPDIIKRYGFGAKVTFTRFLPSRGCNPKYFPKNATFFIEDSTAARKTNQIDVWLPTRNQSINFGSCYAAVLITSKR